MDFLTTKFFWGGVLILWGISMILEKVFRIHIPIIKTVFGIVLIIIGCHLLFEKEAKMSHYNYNYTINDSTAVYDGTQTNYNIVFNRSIIDLRYSRPVNNEIQISVIGGSVDILTPNDRSYNFDIQNIMSETTLPDLKKAPMGKITLPLLVESDKEPINVLLYSVMSDVQILTNTPKLKEKI